MAPNEWPARAFAPRKRQSAVLSLCFTHLCFFDVSTLSLHGSGSPSLYKNGVFPRSIPPLYRTLFASALNGALCEHVFQQYPDYESLLTFLQSEKADITNAPNQHKVTSSNSQMALVENTVSCRALVSALGALQTQASKLKAEYFSLKNLNQKLRPNAFSSPHKNSRGA